MLSASTGLNPSYGYLWWRLRGPSAVLPDGTIAERAIDRKHVFGRIELDHPIAAAAPPDAVGVFGKGDQRLYLANSAGIVAVRLGLDSGGFSIGSFDCEFWSRIGTHSIATKN